MPKYAAKRDGNEFDLVTAARQIGVHMVKAPPLDWWACFRGRWVPVEIKNPDGRNRYTDEQKLFLLHCRERQAPVWTWRTVDDIVTSLNAKVTA